MFGGFLLNNCRLHLGVSDTVALRSDYVLALLQNQRATNSVLRLRRGNEAAFKASFRSLLSIILFRVVHGSKYIK